MDPAQQQEVFASCLTCIAIFVEPICDDITADEPCNDALQVNGSGLPPSEY